MVVSSCPELFYAMRPTTEQADALYLPYSAITFDAARKLSTAAGTPQ